MNYRIRRAPPLRLLPGPRNHKVTKYHVGLFTEAVATATGLLVFSPEGA